MHRDCGSLDSCIYITLFTAPSATTPHVPYSILSQFLAWNCWQATATWQLVQPSKIAGPSTGPAAEGQHHPDMGIRPRHHTPNSARHRSLPSDYGKEKWIIPDFTLTYENLAVATVCDFHLASVVEDEHAANSERRFERVPYRVQDSLRAGTITYTPPSFSRQNSPCKSARHQHVTHGTRSCSQDSRSVQYECS